MAMIHTIAVGFDGSPDAEGAVLWAFELARQVDADVVIVHAIGLLEHATDRGMVTKLEATVRQLTGQSGVDPARVHWRPADGDPCSVLIRTARGPVDADLLVVGSRGQGAHAGLLLGSTSHELAEHADVPLVIVPIGGGGAMIALHRPASPSSEGATSSSNKQRRLAWSSLCRLAAPDTLSGPTVPFDTLMHSGVHRNADKRDDRSQRTDSDVDSFNVRPLLMSIPGPSPCPLDR